MSALDLLLQPYGLDDRSFIAGALVCAIIVCASAAVCFLLTMPWRTD